MPEGQLETVKRITAVLDYMVSQSGDVGVSDVSRALGYNKSVAHRLLTALQADGYLAVDAQTRRYRLGPKILQLGLATLDRLDVRRSGHRREERLWSITGETVGINLRVGDKRIHADGLESPKEVRLAGQLGLESPLYAGASSKAILAFLPEAEQERILATAEGATTADGRPISIGDLRAELHAIRQRGYAVSVAERRAGAFGVASPIFNHLGEVTGSLAVGGPTMRWHEELAAEYGELVLGEARGLSAELGYRGVIGPAGAPASTPR
jgi:IclR family transcriptional regulator, acetate operon repressor